MENKPQVFESKEFGRMEVLTIANRPYFLANACAAALGYKDAAGAVRRHCKGVMKHSSPHPQSPDKNMEVNFIPEGDLYRLIIRSKLPDADRFERYIFEDVLPMVRRYGSFITDETLEKVLESPFFATNIFRVISDERNKRVGLEHLVADLLPKAKYCDSIMRADNLVPVSVIAKEYGMSAESFNKLLHGLKIQYKAGETWLLYQPYADKGYTRTRTYYVSEEVSSVCMYWTQKGRFFLYNTLRKLDIPPLSEAPAAASGRRALQLQGGERDSHPILSL